MGSSKAPLLVLAVIMAALAACSSVTPPTRSYGLGGDPSPMQSNLPLTVEARYEPAPTIAILVVPGFVAGREAELIALAKTECAGRAFCSVGFWASDATAPRRLKMSDQEMTSRIVQFAVNARTGLSKATWNCRLATQVIGDCA